MVQVVDNKSNQVQDLTPQQATQALLSGTHSLQQTDTGKIAMINPDGKVGTLDTKNAYAALAKGYQLASSDDVTKAQDVNTAKGNQITRIFENVNPLGAMATEALLPPPKKGPDLGAAGEFAEKATNELSFGVPNIIREHESDDATKQAMKEQGEEHNIAGGAGSVAGFLGNLALTSGVGGAIGKGTEALAMGGKAAEDVGLGQRLLAKTAGGAAEGVFYGAPQAITEAAVGDKQKAAEGLALNVGIGSILGLGGGAFGELKNALSEASKDAEPVGILDALQAKASKSANEDALRLGGFQKSQLRKIPEDERQALGQFMYDKGLLRPGMNKEDIAHAIIDAHEAAGDNVKAHVKQLDEVLAAKPELQELGYNPARAADRLRSELGAGLDVPMYKSEQNELHNIADSVEAMSKDGTAGGAVDFRTAQDTKNLFQKFKLAKLDPTPKEQLQKQAYGIVRDEMDQAADRVAAASGDNNLFNSYKAAKSDFQNLSRLKVGAENLLAGVGGNRKAGLTDFITGGAAGALAGATHFLGPLGAPLSFIGSIFLKHLAENQGNIIGASAMRKFADADLGKIGLLSALSGSNAIDAKSVGAMGSAIRGGIIKGVPKLADPIASVLGNSSNGLSKQQQFNKLSQHITDTAANPNALADNISTITSTVHHTGAPETATALNAQYTKTAAYLQNALPKPPAPNPFIKQPKNWTPPPQQMQAFKDKLAVVHDPFTVLNELQKGTLNVNHLDALQQVYPAIYQQLQSAAMMAANDSDQTVPFQTRLKLSLLLGKPLDPALNHVAALQQGYAAQPQPNAGRGSDVTAPNLMTDTQRVSSGAPRAKA